MLGLKFHVQNFYGTIYTYNFNHVLCYLFFNTFAWDAIGIFFIRLHRHAIGVLNYCISIQKSNTQQKKKRPRLLRYLYRFDTPENRIHTFRFDSPEDRTHAY